MNRKAMIEYFIGFVLIGALVGIFVRMCSRAQREKLAIIAEHLSTNNE